MIFLFNFINYRLTEKGMVQLKSDILRLIDVRNNLESQKDVLGGDRIPSQIDSLYTPY